MPSERVQRHIDRLLDEADTAFARQDWGELQSIAKQVLLLDDGNEDAHSFLTTAEGMLGETAHPSSPTPLPLVEKGDANPTSFANGRYQVKRFLGEGGKKRVYLAHDTTLDRDVAFALIKTEGLDQTARERVSREAQAMGRLGSHPHIVTVFDLGTELPLPLGEGGGDASPSSPSEALRSEALAHLDFAIAEFREMKMRPSLERALRHREVLKA